MIPSDSHLKIAIVIEPGRLEWQGIILLSSLIAFGRGDFSVHCYCRAENIRGLDRYTKKFLKTHDIPLTGIENDFSPEYPHGNKIIACDHLAASGGRILFLDTDVFLCRPFDLSTLGCEGVGAIPAGMKVPKGDHLWPKMYKHFDLPEPKHRTIALMSATVMMPYYNAGFILFDADTGFAKTWLEVARGLDGMDLPHKRPWLDQLALPIATAKDDIPVTELPHRMNFNVNNTKAVVPADAVFLHYHKAHWLIAHQYVRNLVSSMLPQFSKFAHLKRLFDHYGSSEEAFVNVPEGQGIPAAPVDLKKNDRQSAFIVHGDFAAAEQKTLIVFGMMRGGTTMVAGALNGLGIYMGSDIQSENQEDACFCPPNTPEQMIETIHKRNADHDIWGWKFPNAVNYMDALLKDLRNPHVICVYRDSVANGAGLSRWHGTDGLNAVRNNAIQQRRNIDLIIKMKCPAALVSYEKATRWPDQFIADLGQLVGRDPAKANFDFAGYMKPEKYKRFEDYRLGEPQS